LPYRAQFRDSRSKPERLFLLAAGTHRVAACQPTRAPVGRYRPPAWLRRAAAMGSHSRTRGMRMRAPWMQTRISPCVAYRRLLADRGRVSTALRAPLGRSGGEGAAPNGWPGEYRYYPRNRFGARVLRRPHKGDIREREMRFTASAPRHSLARSLHRGAGTRSISLRDCADDFRATRRLPTIVDGEIVCVSDFGRGGLRNIAAGVILCAA
jgi:hypothetical protein